MPKTNLLTAIDIDIQQRKHFRLCLIQHQGNLITFKQFSFLKISEYDFVSWAELAQGVLYKLTYINKLNFFLPNEYLKGKVSQHSYFRVLIDLSQIIRLL